MEFRVLVTGVSGFLGSGIVRALHERHPEWRITGLDLRQPRDLLEEFFQADITDPIALRPAFAKRYKPDLVIHTAAIVPDRRARYSTKEKDWQRVKGINYDGTVNVLAAAKAAGCTHFVYTSSVTAVIDDLDHDYYNMDEKTPTDLATLHYGRSKVMAEKYVLSEGGNVKVCVLRPCTIIGPEDTQVISLIVDMVAKNETSVIIGDGNNLYDWVYIDNVVEAHILAAENLLTKGTAAGEVIFITNHEVVYFWSLLTFVWAQFDHYPPFRIYIPAWLAYLVGSLLEFITVLTGMPSTLDTGSVKDGIRTHFANNDKAIKLLGYQPKVGLSEGVRRACAGYKKKLIYEGTSRA